jgi:hypothetical protein
MIAVLPALVPGGCALFGSFPGPFQALAPFQKVVAVCSSTDGHLVETYLYLYKSLS